MRYRLQRHDGTDCSATMVPITVLRMVPIQRYRHLTKYQLCNILKIRKKERKILSLIKTSTLHLQLLQRQSIIILSEKSSVDKFQTKSLIILVVIILGAKVFVTVTWGVLLEETGKVFQIFLLVSFEVAAHNDDAPVGDTANAATVFPETDI